MANPRVAWGIDIGNRALKAVKLVRSGTGVKIDDYDLIEHENLLSNAGDNRETLIQTALALFQSKHNLKGLPAAVGVSGQSSFARFIKLPPVEEKQIPQIVKFEAIQQIPFPLDEVEWSYQLFRDEASPDIEVGIFAMKRELVNQHLAYFTASGVNVQAVQMNPLSVYNGLAYDQKLTGTTMIIDLGAENADLLIAEGENVWMRSIPIGGNHFTEALVRDFKLRFERAEELKRTTATSPHGRRILQAMRPVFADLVSEIQRSIGFYSSTHRDSRISRVIALGGTFKLPGLQKYLQQNLGLEVHKIDSIGLEPPSDGKIAAALSENALSSAGAYGLALQAMGEAKITSSLLPQAIQKERAWRAKTKWFAAAAAAVVVGSGLAFGKLQVEQSAFVGQDSARSEIDSTIQTAQGLSSAWKSEIEGAGADSLAQIAQVNTLTEQRNVWPELLNEISSVIPVPPATRPANAPPRIERREIHVEEMQAEYVPAFSSLVAKNERGTFTLPDSMFNQRAAVRDPAALAGQRSRRGAAAGQNFGGGAMPGFTVGEGAGGFAPPPVFQPSGGEGGAAPGTAVPGQQRGYLVTLHLTTPHKDGAKFISDTIAGQLFQKEHIRQAAYDAAKKKLAESGHSGLPPALPYSISRVSLVSLQQLTNDQARQTALITRAREQAARKAAAQPKQLEVPGGVGQGARIDLRQFTVDGEGSGGGGGVPAIPGTPGFPGMGVPGAVNPNDPAEIAKLLVDPITGEDIRPDWQATVLVAVLLDPFAVVDPAAMPTETPPSESPNPE